MKYNFWTAYSIIYTLTVYFFIFTGLKSQTWFSNFHGTFMATYETEIKVLIFCNIHQKTWTRWNSSVWFILVADMTTWTDPFDNLLSVIINNLGLPVTVMWQCYKNIWHSYSILVSSCGGYFETGFETGGFLENNSSYRVSWYIAVYIGYWVMA